MDCSCVRHRDLPGASNLFLDLLHHPDRLQRFYRHLPPAPETYRQAAAEISLPDEHRAALVAALGQANAGNPSLEALAKPGTVAVLTGQQVGLFSGPAYTLYKALTAVKLSRELRAQGIPAVPIFWLATEDHDFAEVNHCWLFDSVHQPAKLEMRTAASGQPVGEVPLAEPPVAELREVLRGFPFGEEVSGLVAECYVPGATMGQAFGRLLGRLTERYGLLQVDPMAPAVRALAAPAIRSALESAPELTAQVLERNRELIDAGYHAQVHVEESTSFVFLLENGRRLTLRRNGREYVTNGRRFTTEELMSRAAELSPNALLRPVVQDSIMPTVAYVGGPAELAYLAQAEVIYRRVLGRMPVPLNRAGFTLLDQRSRKLMEHYRLQLNDFFHGEQALRERLALALIPPDLAATIGGAKTDAIQALERIAGALRDFDLTLVKASARSRQKIAYQLDKMERKVAREILARDGRAGEHAAYLNGLIYPHRHLQERLYSILPFLARHGLELIDQIYDNIRLDCPDHQLLVI
jgi:bacillithiol biosynthesis cysteine-adding enzyme BshC